uniref:Uncharacterized protein n=1 Tax=Bursaphelenchus xylophilus TaxID=6326 RepID=A0A1I7SJD8_BURXY
MFQEKSLVFRPTPSFAADFLLAAVAANAPHSHSLPNILDGQLVHSADSMRPRLAGEGVVGPGGGRIQMCAQQFHGQKTRCWDEGANHVHLGRQRRGMPEETWADNSSPNSRSDPLQNGEGESSYVGVGKW